MLDVIRKLVAVGSEELDAIVAKRIVRGGDHHADIGPQRPRQHGDAWRRDRAEQKDVEPRRREARDHRVLEHIAGEARIAADHHPVSVSAVSENGSHCNADPHGEVRRHRKYIGLAANAVGAEISALHKNSIVLLRHRLLCRPRLPACSAIVFIVPRPRLQICAIFAIKPQYTAPIITSEIITARYNWIFQRFGRVA